MCIIPARISEFNTVDDFKNSQIVGMALIKQEGVYGFRAGCETIPLAMPTKIASLINKTTMEQISCFTVLGWLYYRQYNTTANMLLQQIYENNKLHWFKEIV